MSTNLELITGDIYGVRDSFVSVLSDKQLNFDKEAGFAIQQLTKNDYTMKMAMGNRQSVVDAVINIAAIGITLNPAKKQAYLVPRDGRICLDISYMGLMDLAMDTGSIKWAQAALVYAADTFESNGLDKLPTHKYNAFSTERGAVLGVYVTVKTNDNDYLTHTMTLSDAYAIRDRSSAWKANKSGPWKTDEGEMVKKTCVKQAYKYWPKTERLQNAIQYLNTDGGEGLQAAELAPPEKVLPLLTDARLSTAIEKIKAGEYTTTKLRESFALTSEQEEKVVAELSEENA